MKGWTTKAATACFLYWRENGLWELALSIPAQNSDSGMLVSSVLSSAYRIVATTRPQADERFD
ncbi:hypothetical protein [Sporosarcina sp. Te-1]|uniref:hypothetical protein n=1 Tax=Sporosarcina sp. Te-1 TaxID=2818390 RepID=UPI001A9DE388|nr:hypothetical protein [Sporosarcina sp. Te-1]QTD39450.1 hypothetical protein J3U78_11240 [Sporosarcina sp. Te-1]